MVVDAMEQLIAFGLVAAVQRAVMFVYKVEMVTNKVVVPVL